MNKELSKQKAREYHRLWYQKNKAKASEYQKRWVKKAIEKDKDYPVKLNKYYRDFRRKEIAKKYG